MGNFVKAVWAAYPDARLEIISTGDTGGGLVATQWVFHGTNTGTLPDGTPATGRTVAQPGASFAQFEGDKIRSERVYVDMHDLFEQLGSKPSKRLSQPVFQGEYRMESLSLVSPGSLSELHERGGGAEDIRRRGS